MTGARRFWMESGLGLLDELLLGEGGGRFALLAFPLFNQLLRLALAVVDDALVLGVTSLMVKNCTLSHFGLRFSEENT
jgi:hypothetical protein